MHTITSTYASKIRLAVRALVVLVTAFGLRLSSEQTGAILLAAEAALQLVVRDAAPSEDAAPIE